VTMRAPRWDVAVVGGGPAGAVTAMLLARAGQTVVVLDRSTGNRSSMGETLPPVANALLRDIGIAESFSKQGHTPAEGIVSVWSGSVPRVNDFFVSAQGVGWNLNRALFDAMLLEEAEKAGAQICRDASVVSCRETGDRGWRLQIHRKKKNSAWIFAKYLVDASGRTGASRGLSPSPRVFADRLIGVARFYASEDRSRYMLIEAVDDGWFYSVGIPDGHLVAVYFTDADIYSHARRTNNDCWHSQLQKALHTEQRLRGALQHGGERIVIAATSRRTQITGPGWISIGDAAMSFDPLSSLGIYKAMDSGIRARDWVVGALRHNANTAGYADWSNHIFEQYMMQRLETYREQRRWNGSPFWKRRNGF